MEILWSFHHIFAYSFIFRYLIESGTELDTGPDTALHIALRKQNVAIAHLLLQAGANFEIKDSVSVINL